MANCPIGPVTFQPLTGASGGNPSFGDLVRKPSESHRGNVNRVAGVGNRIVNKIAPAIPTGMVNE
jgi:hypothetical protein